MTVLKESNINCFSLQHLRICHKWSSNYLNRSNLVIHMEYSKHSQLLSVLLCQSFRQTDADSCTLSFLQVQITRGDKIWGDARLPHFIWQIFSTKVFNISLTYYSSIIFSRMFFLLHFILSARFIGCFWTLWMFFQLKYMRNKTTPAA